MRDIHLIFQLLSLVIDAAKATESITAPQRIEKKVCLKLTHKGYVYTVLDSNDTYDWECSELASIQGDNETVKYTMKRVEPTRICYIECGNETTHVLTTPSQTFENEKNQTCSLTRCEDFVKAKLNSTNIIIKQITIPKTNPPMDCTLSIRENNANHVLLNHYIMTNAENIIYDLSYDRTHTIDNCHVNHELPDSRVRYALMPHNYGSLCMEMNCGDYKFHLVNTASMNSSSYEITEDQPHCYIGNFISNFLVRDTQTPTFAFDGDGDSLSNPYVYREFWLPRTSIPMWCDISEGNRRIKTMMTHGKWSKASIARGIYRPNYDTYVINCEDFPVVIERGSELTAVKIPSVDRVMKMGVTVGEWIYTLVSGITYTWNESLKITLHYETFEPMFEVIRNEDGMSYIIAIVSPNVQCKYWNTENEMTVLLTDKDQILNYPSPQPLDLRSDIAKVVSCHSLLEPVACSNSRELCLKLRKVTSIDDIECDLKCRGNPSESRRVTTANDTLNNWKSSCGIRNCVVVSGSSVAENEM